MIKCVISFMGGAALGAITSYVLTRKKYEKEYQERLEEVRGYYKTARKHDIPKNEEKPLPDPKEDAAKYVTNRYKNIANQYVPKTTVKPESISSISLEEWEDNPKGWDREELIYYGEDETLATTDDEVVLIADTVGIETIDILETLDDADVMYVRNNRVQTLYSVTYYPSTSFAELTGLNKEDYE